MNMNKIILEKNRRAYSHFSTLCNALYDFSLDANAKTIKNLKGLVKAIEGGMPLPSGRYGNAVAVALEMQQYKGADFIIQNAKELGVDLESVSSEYGGRNVWNAQQTFEFSQLESQTPMLEEDDESYKDSQMLNHLTLEKRREAYHHFSTLCRALNDFSFDGNDETAEKLRELVKTFKDEMPLPSGGYGNSLAIALEMQLYQGALFIIQNADELGIDLESVSSNYDGKNVWTAQQTFELSQLGFKTTKISDVDEFYKDYPLIMQDINRNIDAALEISRIFKGKLKENGK